MNNRRNLCKLGLLFALAPVAAYAAGVQVRFYPDKVLRTYEVDARHGVQSALLQNAAVINDSAAPIVIERIEFELQAGGQMLQVHRLGREDLERAVKKGAAVQHAGLLERYSFQFRPELLLGKGITLTDALQLPPQRALLIAQRYFVFSGVADRLEVRAFGRKGQNEPVKVLGVGILTISSRASQTEFDFPLAGRWFIGTGQALHNPHRWVVPEEFALDLVKLGDGGSSHKGDGSKRTDFYAYGEPIVAAADGIVLACQSSIPETDANLRQTGETAEAYQARVLALQDELLSKGPLQAAGNYIVLEHPGAEFSFYAHLQPGSVKIARGDHVKRGQTIARLGHSGNSTEPHLHFQVTDGPEPLFSTGIPIRFRNISLPFADAKRALQDGDLVETLR